MKSRSAKYNIANLAGWWSDKTLAEVTAANCRGLRRRPGRKRLRALISKGALAAAIRHWHW